MHRLKKLLITSLVILALQEKMKGKNKLAPRLLGITRESVLRLDERTKDIMKVWPLTSVKRWAASPKSFTLVGYASIVYCLLAMYHLQLEVVSLKVLRCCKIAFFFYNDSSDL